MCCTYKLTNITTQSTVVAKLYKHFSILKLYILDVFMGFVYSSSSVICQTTGPKPLAKRFLHTVRSRASSFNSQYHLLSLRSSSNFLRLPPCLLVNSICPFIFPSITCFRRQFLRKMWPIQLAFRFIISCSLYITEKKSINLLYFVMDTRWVFC